MPIDLQRLLRKHNGQDEDATSMYFVNRLLSCGEIQFETDELLEINDEILTAEERKTIDDPIADDDWWHPRLMLVFSDGNGGGIAVDRTSGEVWSWDHDGGLFGIKAPSISKLFEWMTLALDEGRFEGPTEYSSPYFPQLDPADGDS